MEFLSLKFKVCVRNVRLKGVKNYLQYLNIKSLETCFYINFYENVSIRILYSYKFLNQIEPLIHCINKLLYIRYRQRGDHMNSYHNDFNLFILSKIDKTISTNIVTCKLLHEDTLQHLLTVRNTGSIDLVAFVHWIYKNKNQNAIHLCGIHTMDKEEKRRILVLIIFNTVNAKSNLIQIG